MNKIITAVKLASRALLAQKSRAILTILGVSIGIAVVIAIMAASRGLNKLVLGQLETFSPETISIETKVPSVKKTSSENAFGQSSGITITTLKDKDLDTVNKHPNIAAAYGHVMGQAVAKYGGVNRTVILAGQSYNLREVEKLDLTAGRIFTKEEEGALSQVAVLGATAKEKLFGEDDALGKTIYLQGKPFRVVGVAAKRGAAFFVDMDNLVILPTKTMQKRLLGIDYFRAIVAKVKNRAEVKTTVAELETSLRENHDITDPNKDDFAISTMEEAAEMLSTVVKGLTFLLVALVCVSLVVGGVGIMNIMYVSVTERTFEIGLRKALGATRGDILWQFLSEAVLLTLAGGVLGIILGAILAGVIYFAAVYYNLSWIYSIPLSSIILAVGFSAAVGLFFGLYPAKKAASLDPVEALRRE